MNLTMKTICLIFSLILMAGTAFAEDKKLWEKEFVQALQKGKMVDSQDSEGLGYTPDENTVLSKAIKRAVEQKAPPCEAMKIAIDLKYTAYNVIYNIFSHGGEINLNQLCMCATESGINKQLVAKAATEVTNKDGERIFPRDEIAQAQCLNDVGLGYTEAAAPPPPIPPPPKPKPFSVATSGQE